MIECQDCGVEFLSKLELEVHTLELVHHQQMEKMGKTRHECTACKFFCTTIAEYSQHVETEGHKQQIRMKTAQDDIREPRANNRAPSRENRQAAHWDHERPEDYRRDRYYDRSPLREDRQAAPWDYGRPQDYRRDHYHNYDRPPSRDDRQAARRDHERPEDYRRDNYDRPPSGYRDYNNDEDFRRPPWEEQRNYREWDRRWDDHSHDSGHVMAPRSTVRNANAVRGRPPRNSDSINSHNAYKKTFVNASTSSRYTTSNMSDPGPSSPAPNDPPAPRRGRPPTKKDSVMEKRPADKAKTPPSKAKGSPLKKKVSLPPAQRKTWEKVQVSATAIAKRSVERQARNRNANFILVPPSASDSAGSSNASTPAPPLPTAPIVPPVAAASPVRPVVNLPVAKRPFRSRSPAPPEMLNPGPPSNAVMQLLGNPVAAAVEAPPVAQPFQAGGPVQQAELEMTLNHINLLTRQQQPPAPPMAAVAPVVPDQLVVPVVPNQPVAPVPRPVVLAPVAPERHVRDASPLRNLAPGAVLNLIKQENPEIIELPGPVNRVNEIGRLAIEEDRLKKEMDVVDAQLKKIDGELVNMYARMDGAVFNPAVRVTGSYSDERLREIAHITIEFCQKRKELERACSDQQRLTIDLARIALQKKDLFNPSA